MRALTTALFAKAAGSAFNTAVGSRFYESQAPDETAYPYAVYFVVSSVPDNTFSEKIEDTLVQFSLYSSAPSSGEVKDICAALRSLYDDCALTISGSELLWMVWSNTTLTREEHTTPEGMSDVWACHVDYDIKVKVG